MEHGTPVREQVSGEGRYGVEIAKSKWTAAATTENVNSPNQGRGEKKVASRGIIPRGAYNHVPNMDPTT